MVAAEGAASSAPGSRSISAATACHASLSSSARTVSRQASKEPKPRSIRRVRPRSSQIVARERFCRKRRSWLMSTTAERSPFSSASSHSMVERSRWLVGSSSSRMSGAGASVRAIAARLSARQVARPLLAGQAQLLQELTGPIGLVGRSEPRLDEGEHGLVPAHVGLLGQIPDRRAWLREARAAVGLDHARGHAQQGRLARPVAAHEADAVARPDREVGRFEQRRAPEGERDALEAEKGRGHGSAPPSRSGPAGQPRPNDATR